MAQIVVRNLGEDVKRRLKRRAENHGRSMEEEAREILREAVGADQPRTKTVGLGTQIAALFRDIGFEGDELDKVIEELRREQPRPVSFEE
jgi:plasmid stability protein